MPEMSKRFLGAAIMPIHDWTRVPAGIFHDFHTTWMPLIKTALNNGLLPKPYYALAEQVTTEWNPDVLTLQAKNGAGDLGGSGEAGGGTATLVKAAPKTRFAAKADGDIYHSKARQLTIRHVSDDRLIAVLEIVSPGNKANLSNFEVLVDKVAGGIAHGIHFSLVDLFPPTARDPEGVHGEIWKRFSGVPFELPGDKPLTTVAYSAGMAPMAFIEPAAVDEELPPLPLFLNPDAHILVPLEETYQAAWRGVPERWRGELVPA
jgi:hypothetical protein